MDELVDVVDAFGKSLGRQASKKDVHDQELLHRGAQTWIYNSNGELLLQLRDPGVRIYPNTWDISATGHLAAGESPEQGALREAAEELGLSLQLTDLHFIGVVRIDQPVPPANWVHCTFDSVYIVHRDLDVHDLALQPGETAAVRWCPLSEFEADVHDPERVKKYSVRPPYLFDMIIFEIRKALAKMK